MCIFLSSPQAEFSSKSVSEWEPASAHSISGTKTSATSVCMCACFEFIIVILRQSVCIKMALYWNRDPWMCLVHDLITFLTSQFLVINSITPSLTSSLSDCYQGEDIRMAESTAPWISDRRWNSLSLFLWQMACPIRMIKPKTNTINNVILSLCSTMAPLIAEYDQHINDMTVQLKKYQVNQEIFQQVA